MTAAVNPSAGPPAPKPQRFLVTGAGSGIGLAITQALAGQGHRVLAGARRDDDLAMLAQLANVTPLRLEVSDPTQVAAAAAHVAAAGGELHGLVQARGRVVCIGSQGGSITQPLYGPYTMSKFALEAFADCLGQEMAAHGVAVSIVQPGAVHTRIGATAGAANEARLRATPAPFDVDAARVLAAWSAPAPPQDDAGEESASRRKPATPEFVAEAVLHALLAATPLRRYLGGTRWEGERVLRADCAFGRRRHQPVAAAHARVNFEQALRRARCDSARAAVRSELSSQVRGARPVQTTRLCRPKRSTRQRATALDSSVDAILCAARPEPIAEAGQRRS